MNEPVIIDTKGLPDLSLLQDYNKKLEKYAKPLTPESRKNSNRGLFDITSDIIRKPGYRKLIEQSKIEGKKVIEKTLAHLVNVFDRDSTYLEKLPSIHITDPVDVSHTHSLIAIDGFTAPISYVQINYFTLHGNSYLGEPNGPVISLHLPDVDHSVIVEESFHFLQWFYTISNHQKNSNRDTNLKKNASDQVNNNNVSLNIERSFSLDIALEAEAYFILSLFNLSRDLTPGDNHKDHYESLFNKLINENRDACFHEILEFNKAESFEDLMKNRNHFTRMVGSFPDLMNHYLGYSLGKELHNHTYTKQDVINLTNLIFSTPEDPNNRLDGLINYLRKK